MFPRMIGAYLPPFAKSRPLMIPAPEILWRAIILKRRKDLCQSYIVVKWEIREHTVFVRVLKTKTEPAEVPAKMYLPVGSNRTTVMTDLIQVYEIYSHN